MTDTLEIHSSGGIQTVTDNRLSEIRFAFAFASNKRDPAKDRLFDALSLVGERNSYHPVRDYLNARVWDGVGRVDGWLTKYAGAEDTRLNRAIGRKTLTAAVRRAFQPGCKYDHVLVLLGSQNAGKSSLVRALSPSLNWVTDQVKVGHDAKETIERTRGAWLVELAELDGMDRKEANAVKSFVTTTSDRARPAYGRFAIDCPRQFVLIGTTNDTNFLTDLTGNRRWWPVTVTNCDVRGLMDARDQLWAEAVAIEPQEKLWLDEPELAGHAVLQAAAATDYGPWYDHLHSVLPDGPLKITVVDAWAAVGISKSDSHKITLFHRGNLKKAMAGLGFEPDKVLRRNGKNTRTFLRGSCDHAKWWSPGDATGAAVREYEKM